jgi:hypothetical protein
MESKHITIHDLFRLHVRIGTYINLIGCQNKRSQVGINNDLLGLLIALIFASAISIVAAFWSIQINNITNFQEAFFDKVII